MGAYPSLLNVFLGRPVFGEVFLERIPFATIPNEISESAQWLLHNFEKKVCTKNFKAHNFTKSRLISFLNINRTN